MALYEHIFLARQDVTAQQVEALTEQIKTKIASLGGAVTKVEPWGLKSLAFRVKKNRKAHYALMNIDAPPEAVTELERQERLSTDIIRSLTVRVDEHETGPSPMMRRAERDEREGRGERGERDRDGRRGGRRDFRDRDRDHGPREARDDTEAQNGDITEGEEDS